MPTIGEKIAELRRKNGMTQEELASLLGISAQSVSKWETGATMPDILLLPVLADVFGVRIDALFGKNAQDVVCLSADDVLDAACGSLRRILTGSVGKRNDKPLEEALAEYERALSEDRKLRSIVIRSHGVIYYREEVGGLLLKRPQDGWMSLLQDAQAAKTVALLANEDFRKALYAILNAGMAAFTVPTLCRACEIEDAQALEAAFAESRLFKIQTVRVEEQDVKIYELVCAHRQFMLFAILRCAKELAEFDDCFYYYYGDHDFPWK